MEPIFLIGATERRCNTIIWFIHSCDPYVRWRIHSILSISHGTTIPDLGFEQDWDPLAWILPYHSLLYSTRTTPAATNAQIKAMGGFHCGLLDPGWKHDYVAEWIAHSIDRSSNMEHYTYKGKFLRRFGPPEASCGCIIWLSSSCFVSRWNIILLPRQELLHSCQQLLLSRQQELLLPCQKLLLSPRQWGIMSKSFVPPYKDPRAKRLK